MVTLARMGYNVHSFDYESLGRSEPTHAQELADDEPRFFIPDFVNLVDDAVTFAVTQIAKHADPGCQLFLFGESMGGWACTSATPSTLAFRVTVDSHESSWVLVVRVCHSSLMPIVFLCAFNSAVGLLVSRRLRTSGAIILAPMCKLGEGMKPGRLMTAVLTGLAHLYVVQISTPCKHADICTSTEMIFV